ncbi:hypothetical protein GN316_18105 [Xylophilus sp. Kf1]|nr:hypothetical protein [Xylophilus sp. Kf1]
MGGYGALKYSACLQATAALAFSAQTSIDPRDGMTDPGYSRYHDRSLHANMAIQAADVVDNTYLLYDPKIAFDLNQPDLIRSAVPACRTVALPYAGHDCIKIAAGTASMSTLLHLCLDGNPAAVRTAVRAMRATSGARLSGLAQAMAARRPGCARTLVETHSQAMDGKQRGLFYDVLANRYLRARDFPKAMAAANIAHDLLPHRSSIPRTKAVCLESAGRLEEAVHFYRLYLAEMPDDALIQNSMARTYLKLGQLIEAAAASAKAIALNAAHLSVSACAAAIDQAIAAQITRRIKPA